MTPQPSPSSLSHSGTHTHIPPISCDKPPPVKLTPTIPLPKHAALCQQVLVSSEQRNQKCEWFLRHGRGLLIPSHCLFLSLLLSPFFCCPLKRKNCNFFLSCVVVSFFFFHPSLHSGSFMPLCVHLHGHDEGPHAGWLGSLKGLRRDGVRQKSRREMAARVLMERKEKESTKLR